MTVGEIDPSRRPADEPAAVPPDPANPHGALTPAALQRCLRSAVFGHRIFYYPTIGSTNERALELAAAEEPEGGLVLAEEQTAGRGRRERTWCSRAYAGIYASLILRPAIAAPRAPLLTFMAAVAVADALNEVAGLPARIKWPNDVLVGGRKIAGILGEVRGNQPEVREMVVGIGINVNQKTGDFPADLAGGATSVCIELGAPGDRTAILASVLEGFERRYARLLRDGAMTLLHEWESLSALPAGAPVAVGGPAGRIEGTFAGIDEEGGLLLLDRGGTRHRVPFGEIIETAAP
jgi:BirA family transcriptional regulator, biotin operon repressor / biotin---[acetyl-CoA-carboxylase] ligase